MKFSFSKSKGIGNNIFTSRSKNYSKTSSDKTFDNADHYRDMSEPYMYESGIDEDFTDYDAINDLNNK